MEDRNDLAYWFPRLEAAGVPVPRRHLVRTGVELMELPDGCLPAGHAELMEALARAVASVGGPPAFLRTGHGSGKHQWARTCCVRALGNLAAHVAELVDWSATVDFLGLPTSTWAVRELLDARAPFTAFEGLPIARERRYFFRDGKVQCHHPYFPEGALEEGNPSTPKWRTLLHQLNKEPQTEVALLSRLTAHVARHFEGAWSLDWLLVPRPAPNWYAIDMAEAGRSFHWPECAHCPPEQRALWERRAAKAARPRGPGLLGDVGE
jgi:hypothetical protein